MKNIFENVSFGDVFKTRDGKKAVFIGIAEEVVWSKYVFCYVCHIEGLAFGTYYYYNEDGLNFHGVEQDIDIISRWEEPIDDDKLEKIAKQECIDMMDSGKCHADDVFEFYKAGYRKAKEE